MRKHYVLIVLALIMFLLAACGDDSGNNGQSNEAEEDTYGIETNMSEEMESFSFTDQNGEAFGLEDLEGKWWIADLVFTNCTTVCLPMTTNMSSLQDKFTGENIDVELVSFSVDPDNDTPEVLKEYAGEYDADESNWHFLTGYDFETIQDISVGTFRQILEQAPPGEDQVTHGTRFFLIDPEGNVIKSYNGATTEEMDTILEDMKTIDETTGNK